MIWRLMRILENLQKRDTIALTQENSYKNNIHGSTLRLKIFGGTHTRRHNKIYHSMIESL